MNESDLKERNYVFCSVVFDEPLTFVKVLTPKMAPTDAAYVARKWAEQCEGRKATHVHTYPGNYIKRARELFALGMTTDEEPVAVAVQPLGRYVVKCDDCKAELRHTDSIIESAEGGRCAACANANVARYGRTKVYR